MGIYDRETVAPASLSERIRMRSGPFQERKGSLFSFHTAMMQTKNVRNAPPKKLLACRNIAEMIQNDGTLYIVFVLRISGRENKRMFQIVTI
jgi:hypothetical protein